MYETEKQLVLAMIKDIKIQSGVLVSEEAINNRYQDIINLSDDDLMLKIAGTLGEFIECLKGNEHLNRAYGMAIAHFVLEKEVQRRNLYP